MTVYSLDGARTGLLNDALGLANDSDNRFGTTGVRNLGLQDATRRLWPEMAIEKEETVTVTADTIDYLLTTIREVSRLELTSTSAKTWYSDAGKDWSAWYSPADGGTHLRLPQAIDTTVTLKAHGYTPYAIPALGTDYFDVRDEDMWVLVEGAMAFLYRRMMHSFMTYERHENENRKTILSPQELVAMYRESEARFQAAKQSHRRRTISARRAVRIRA